MEHENEIIHWFCSLKSRSFSFPFSFLTLSAFAFTFLTKKLDLTELNFKIYIEHCFFYSNIHLSGIRYGCLKCSLPLWLLTFTLMLAVFPRTWSLIHAFGHSLHLQNVAILLQKGKEMHVGGHTHMNTHSYTPDSVQLFNCLDPDVLHNYFHLWCISVTQ